MGARALSRGITGSERGERGRVRLLPAIAAAATGFQVGSAMVATRFVVDQSGPASLALLRYVIGFLCLLPFVLLAAPRPRFEWRDLLPIGLLGITQFGILVALLNYGLRFIPSGRAALIFARLDVTIATRPVRPTQRRYAVDLLDMNDPPRLRDEAVVTLHELLNLGVRGHFLSLHDRIVLHEGPMMPACLISPEVMRAPGRAVCASVGV